MSEFRLFAVKFGIFSAILFCAFVASGCATHQLAKDFKLIGFEEDISKGKSIGQIRGEDCQTFIFGFPTGNPPSLDRAFSNAKKRGSAGSADFRYVNDIMTSYEGWNALVVAKQCLNVQGQGFR